MDYSTLARPLEGAADGFVFSLNSLYARLEQLRDQRRRRGKRYPLAFVLTVTLVAKLAGATWVFAALAMAPAHSKASGNRTVGLREREHVVQLSGWCIDCCRGLCRN